MTDAEIEELKKLVILKDRKLREMAVQNAIAREALAKISERKFYTNGQMRDFATEAQLIARRALEDES